MRKPGRAMIGLALLLPATMPAVAFGQDAAPQADPASVVDRFLRALRRGNHDRLGRFVAESVTTGEGRSLSRTQVSLLYQGYTAFMFGPLRSFACDAPVANAVTCRLNFQSSWLRERYAVESGLISAIEILPATGEAASK